MRRKSPTTRPSLLIRLRDRQDRQAWESFVEIYAPLVFGYARSRGLQDADAADLTQEVLRRVHGGIGGFDYDPQRGKFRAWLLTITQNALRRHRTRASREPQGTGDTGVQRLLEQESDAVQGNGSFWEQEYHRCLFRWVARRIQAEFRTPTWQAFWATAVESVSAKEAAEKLGMSVGAVYTAKSRVLASLRDEIKRMQREELADF